MTHILGPSKSLRTIGPPYLPPFSKSRNGYLRVRCRPSGTTPTHAEISKILTTASPSDPFAQQWSLDTAISGAPQTIRAPWTNNGTTWTNNGTTQPGSISTALSVKHPFTGINRVNTFSSGALICIGNETSKAMDRLKLQDDIIPHLRALMCETRSSRWEEVLSKPQWGLDHKAAKILAQAMHADITGNKVC
jgi:hypothetical protein